MKAIVSRPKLNEISNDFNTMATSIDQLIADLHETVETVNLSNDAKELQLFHDIFDGTAINELRQLQDAMTTWSTKFHSIAQVYYTAQKECYRKALQATED